jgi:hypothetical protein
LSELLGGEEVPLGISFEQQRRSGNSVPDGSILQEPLHIVIETKVDMGVNVDQLIRHFEAFTHGRTGNYLVLLTKHDVPESQVAGVVAKSKETGVIFKHVTFERLCEQLEDFAQSHETHLWRVVEDFRAYCSEMNLLPDRRKWLRIVPCGTTFNLNVKWDVYYQPTERSYSPHEYLGTYNQKAVQYVGRVAAIYDNDQVGGAMVLKLNVCRQPLIPLRRNNLARTNSIVLLFRPLIAAMRRDRCSSVRKSAMNFAQYQSPGGTRAATRGHRLPEKAHRARRLAPPSPWEELHQPFQSFQIGEVLSNVFAYGDAVSRRKDHFLAVFVSSL